MFESLKSQFILNFVDDERWRYLVNGLANTLKITFASVVLGIIIGVIIAIVRSTWDKTGADMRPGVGKFFLRLANGFCKLYLTVIRGTPVVVQLMIIYYIIFAASNNGVGIAMLAFGINSGAYVAEIIRGGIMSTGERIHRSSEGDLGCRLRFGAGSDQGRRHHPRPYLFRVYAADRRGAHLSRACHFLHLAGGQAGKEASFQ